MKIVILGPVFPYRGGIAQYTGLMSQNLSKEHTVINVSFSLQYPKILYRNEQKDFSNDTFKAPDTRYWLNTVNPISWASTARRINSLAPDLVIVQWWHPFFAPAYWSLLKVLKRDIRVLFCCHNVLPHEGFPCKKLLTRMALGQGDGFIVQSTQDEADLHALIQTKNSKRVLHPTYNAFRWQGVSRQQARETLGITAEREVLLFFGFIRKYKGLKHLLRAMPEILAARPHAQLWVVGEFFEGDKADYIELMDSLHLPEDAIRLMDGYMPDKEVEPYFAASDLVVLPYESATQSGIAQMAYGFEKPVIATAVGGLPEVVLDGKTGYVVPPQDEKALADAVIRFFKENKAAEFSESIHEEAYKYSWDRMNETVRELYEGCKQ